MSKLRGEVLKWRGDAGSTRGEAGGTKREAGGARGARLETTRPMQRASQRRARLKTDDAGQGQMRMEGAREGT